MSDSENVEQALNEHDMITEAVLADAYEEDGDDEDAEPITAQKVSSLFLMSVCFHAFLEYFY